MYQKKEYATLRTVSNITSGFGWLIVGIFVLIGLLVGWKSGGFFAGLLFGIFSGIAGGIPFVVCGQLVSVFLDQKELLEEIHSSLKKD